MRIAKRNIIVLIGIIVLLPFAGDAQSGRERARGQNRKAKVAARQTSKPTADNSGANGRKQAYMKKALALANNKQYEDASKLLFQMSRSPMFADNSAQV